MTLLLLIKKREKRNDFTFSFFFFFFHFVQNDPHCLMILFLFFLLKAKSDLFPCMNVVSFFYGNQGYHGDTSKTFLCGNVSDGLKRLVKVIFVSESKIIMHLYLVDSLLLSNHLLNCNFYLRVLWYQLFEVGFANCVLLSYLSCRINSFSSIVYITSFHFDIDLKFIIYIFWQVTEECMERGIAVCKDGASFKKIGKRIRYWFPSSYV